MIYFAISLVIALSAVVFAVSNAEVVSISFLFWAFEGSLAYVLILTFVLGVIAALIAVIPSYTKSYFGSRKLRQELQKKKEVPTTVPKESVLSEKPTNEENTAV